MSGFSLIELLVVVAIIAMLAGLLLLALGKARDKVRTVVCANNLRQLQVCWHLYSLDNRNILVPNNFIYNGVSGNSYMTGASWCPGLAPDDTNFDNLRKGLLFPYNSDVGIYHCPSDNSTIKGTSLERTRSYSMSQSVNGYPEFNRALALQIPSFKKFESIAGPSPSKLFVFLDVHEDSITDSIFGTPTKVWGTLDAWWDLPANRHNQGCVFSFADGHVERWKWRVPKVARGVFPQPLATNETDDHERVLAGTRQNF
jgi:prepilin-type N-terminal cleavage/methylation domain-containing protein/prepilin-type processing-associated H-X9-DG protein